jgi:hypothetical protein
MEVLTEQQTARLKLLPKPIDDMTDDELEAFLDSTIRPNRGKQPRRKTAANKVKVAKPGGLDDLSDLA